MSEAQDVAADESTSQQSLESLGYRQELNRVVNSLGHLALILSDITPTASLLVVGTAVVATAGTGSVWSYLIGCFIALNVAFCMGELGSMFPVAGGLFSIVTRVLGKATGFVAMVDYIGQAIFLPASARSSTAKERSRPAGRSASPPCPSSSSSSFRPSRRAIRPATTADPP